MRMRSATDAAVEQTFNEGSILRTHALRPTWHFVRPADIRWLLALTAPRIKRLMAYRHRQLGLDPRTLRRTNAASATSVPRITMPKKTVFGCRSTARCRVSLSPGR